jgi:arsenate reductase (glutaredoxin)
LTAKGIEFQSVDYTKKDALSAGELERLLRSARLRPQDVLRTKEDAYRQYVAGRDLGDEELIKVMSEHPELIQRPIVVRGNKAVLARPMEKLAALGIK